MKSAALLSFGSSGLLAVLAWALLNIPFLTAFAGLLALGHLGLHYSSASPVPPSFKAITMTRNVNSVEVKPGLAIQIEAGWKETQTDVAALGVDEESQHKDECRKSDADVQTLRVLYAHSEMQTPVKSFLDSPAQHSLTFADISLQATPSLLHQDTQYDPPQRPRNVQLQTYFESVHRAVQVVSETAEKLVMTELELGFEAVPGVDIQGKEDYMEFENEERGEQEVAALAPEEAGEGSEELAGMGRTEMERILREIQVEAVPAAEEKPVVVEEIDDVAKMAYLNPIIQTHGKLLNSLLLSSTAAMSDRLSCCFYLCLSPSEFDQFFGVLPYDARTIDVYPIYPRDQARDEGTLSTWLLCSYMSDYIVIVLDIGQSPELQYSENLYRLFKALQRLKKQVFVFHVVRKGFGFRESERKFNEMTEMWGRGEAGVTHFEMGTGLGGNVDLIQHIREQMEDQGEARSFEERYKAALEATVNELYIIKNSKDKELPVEESDVDLSPLREGFLASITLEATWKCSIREQYTKIVPETQVLISPLQYHLDEKLSCQVRISALSQAENCVMRCAVFSNLPDITFRQLNVISSFMVTYERKSVLILPFLLPTFKSSSNHLNSPAFDSLFTGQLMRILCNCLILNLHYDAKGELIEPEDHFATLSAIVRAHYREFEMRGTKKPLLVIHNLQQDGNSEELYEGFKGCLKKCTKLMNKWRHARGLSRVRTHKHVSEGYYAFDEEGQVIHRLVVAKPPNIGWVLYNSILFKIMYDAVVNDRRAPLTVDLGVALSETIDHLVEIRDEEVLHPAPDHSEVHPARSPITESSVFDYTIPLQPSWTLSLLGELPGEEVSMSAEIL